MTAKMDWELSPEELEARIAQQMFDGSDEEAHRLITKVFPSKSDNRNLAAPRYGGWAIREAFLAGVRWERERAEATDDPLNHLPMGAGFPIS